MEGLHKVLSIQEETYSKIRKAHINFGKSPKERITRGYVESRLETLEKYWLNFKNTHDQLVAAIPLEDRSKLPYFKDDIYNECEEIFYQYKGELKTTTARLSETEQRHGNDDKEQPSKHSTEVLLPRINLPTFSGDYTEWQSFHDLFQALIHKNNDLEDVQKLHYLKLSLTGEAEGLLRTVPTTSDNYAQAWSILKKRYSNKRYIANCVFKKLFGQRIITQVSSQSLRSLLDTTVECLNALNNLNLPVQHWDAIIVYIIVSKLDLESHQQWEESACADCSNEIPNLERLKVFIEARFRTLEMIESSNKFQKFGKTKAFLTTVSSQCAFCDGDDHYIYHCKKFAQQPVEERYNFVQINGLCFNCLIPNHLVLNCKQTTSCRICNKKHHSLLHLERRRHEIEKHVEGVSHKDHEVEENQVTSHFSTHKQPGQNVLLATALVDVPSGNGDTHIFRALIDQGSQASFVTENMVQLLGLKRKRINGVVTGIGEGNKHTKYMVEFTLKSRNNTTFTMQVQAYILNTLTTHLPSQEVDINWKKLYTLTLADPTFCKPNKVDILLGADVYSKIIDAGLIRGPSGIIAQSTHLGWILSGETRSLIASKQIVSLHTHTLDNDILKKFWELENDSHTTKSLMTQEEERCEEIYMKTTERDDTGRYIVHLPLKGSVEETVYKCGDTKRLATKRLLQLEKRFEKNEKLKTEYTKVIKEYAELGHMEMVEDNNLSIYLPHHAVVREDRDTTKVRVVYNASAKGSNGISLNDNMMIGPKLQPDLYTLVIKWRLHRICLIGDIVKMYRQIKVTKQHADLQRILWRDQPHEKIQSYRLLTVTFGTASAPYLAVKTLEQLANDERSSYPMAAEIVKTSFYMDDLMTGAETIEEAKMIYNEVSELTHLGGFKMQKWSSNSSELLQTISQERDTTDNLEFKMDPVIKILGLTWERYDDMFKFIVNLAEDTHPITKRSILSCVTRLFDPFGWLAPVLITAKIIIQKLWLSGVDWDQEVTNEMKQEWNNFKVSLKSIQSIRIQRWLNINSNNVQIEIHGFCDASMAAYAAVVYLKVIDKDGSVHINIIAAKSRVAPLKQISIPRLELCAATLLTKLLSSLMDTLKIPKTDVFAWTDSTIVLAWLQSHPSKWQTFVANRVSEIVQTLDNDITLQIWHQEEYRQAS